MELLSKNLIRNGQKDWQIARCGSKSRVLEGDCGFGWEKITWIWAGLWFNAQNQVERKWGITGVGKHQKEMLVGGVKDAEEWVDVEKEEEHLIH